MVRPQSTGLSPSVAFADGLLPQDLPLLEEAPRLFRKLCLGSPEAPPRYLSIEGRQKWVWRSFLSPCLPATSGIVSRSQHRVNCGNYVFLDEEWPCLYSLLWRGR